MLPNNGTYEVFVIQCAYNRGIDWYVGLLDHCESKVPVQYRWTKDYKQLEPFQTFSSSGKCWQETRIHGSFSLDKAEQLISWLRKYNPEHKFRIAKYRISQEIIGTYECIDD
jgi:hypothetical protein